MSGLSDTLIIADGGRKITLPANSTYSIPSITFYDVPLEVVRSFVRPIENSPATAVFRQALAAHANATWTGSAIEIRGKSDKNNDTGAYAETVREPWAFGQTTPVIDTVGGVTNGVDLNVPRITTALIDIFTGDSEDWSQSGYGKLTLASSNELGFTSVADFAASVLWHELGHIYVREFSNGLKGHGEVAKEILAGSYNGIQSQDILVDDVFRSFQYTPSLYGGYFSDNGTMFLSGYATTYDRILRAPNGRLRTATEIINNPNIYNGTYKDRAGIHPNRLILNLASKAVSGELKDSQGRWIGNWSGEYNSATGTTTVTYRIVYTFAEDENGNRIKDLSGNEIRLAETETLNGLTSHRGYEFGTNEIISHGNYGDSALN